MVAKKSWYWIESGVYKFHMVVPNLWTFWRAKIFCSSLVCSRKSAFLLPSHTDEYIFAAGLPSNSHPNGLIPCNAFVGAASSSSIRCGPKEDSVVEVGASSSQPTNPDSTSKCNGKAENYHNNNNNNNNNQVMSNKMLTTEELTTTGELRKDFIKSFVWFLR